MITIKPVSIGGHDYPVTLTPDHHFRAEHDGAILTAPGYEALAEKLKRSCASEKVRVEVPFTMIQYGGQVVKCVATGIHGGNGNVMYRVQGSREVQQRPGGTILRELADGEYLELVRLRQELDEAKAALSDFLTERRLGIERAVRDAVNAAKAPGD